MSNLSMPSRDAFQALAGKIEVKELNQLRRAMWKVMNKNNSDVNPYCSVYYTVGEKIYYLTYDPKNSTFGTEIKEVNRDNNLSGTSFSALTPFYFGSKTSSSTGEPQKGGSQVLAAVLGGDIAIIDTIKQAIPQDKDGGAVTVSSICDISEDQAYYIATISDILYVLNPGSKNTDNEDLTPGVIWEMKFNNEGKSLLTPVQLNSVETVDLHDANCLVSQGDFLYTFKGNYLVQINPATGDITSMEVQYKDKNKALNTLTGKTSLTPCIGQEKMLMLSSLNKNQIFYTSLTDNYIEKGDKVLKLICEVTTIKIDRPLCGKIKKLALLDETNEVVCLTENGYIFHVDQNNLSSVTKDPYQPSFNGEEDSNLLKDATAALGFAPMVGLDVIAELLAWQYYYVIDGFEFGPSQIVPNTSKNLTLDSALVTNNTDNTVSYFKDFSASKASSFEYGLAQSISITAGYKIGGGIIPTEISIAFTIGLGFHQTWTETTTESWTARATVAVNPNNSAQLTYELTEAAVEIPFTAVVQLYPKVEISEDPEGLLALQFKEAVIENFGKFTFLNFLAKINGLFSNVQVNVSGTKSGRAGVSAIVNVDPPKS